MTGRGEDDPRESIRRGRQRRFVASALTLAVGALLLVPLPPPAEPTGWLADLPLDKLVHAALFFLLARSWLGVLGRNVGLRLHAVLLLAIVAYGGLLELVQGASGWRAAEWGDLAADALGAAIAWVVGLGVRRARGQPAPSEPR